MFSWLNEHCWEELAGVAGGATANDVFLSRLRLRDEIDNPCVAAAAASSLSVSAGCANIICLSR